MNGCFWDIDCKTKGCTCPSTPGAGAGVALVMDWIAAAAAGAQAPQATAGGAAGGGVVAALRGAYAR